MDLNFTQLRTFYWVARLGGFRRAAERIHAAQPTVSARIAALEERLGATLLERRPDGVSPTPRGRRLLAYAEQIMQVVEQIAENVAQAEAVEAELRIGVSETIVHSWLPRYIQALGCVFPRLNLDLTVDASVNLRDALMDRAIDIGLLMGPVSAHMVANVDLPSFDMRLIRARGLPQQSNDALFRELPVITFARNTRPYQELREILFARYGAQARIFASASLSACMQMVKDGVGVGALPAAVVEDDLRSGALCAVEPGWSLRPLRFTASYLATPPSYIAKAAAAKAREVSIVWMADRKSGSELI